MSDFCQDQRRSDLAAAVTPPLHPARSLQPTLHLSRPSLQIVPVTLSDIGQGIKVVTLVTVKEWLIEHRDTANSDEDTEHISGWSLFFQCRCNGSAKVVLIIMQIELDARAVSNDNIGL